MADAVFTRRAMLRATPVALAAVGIPACAEVAVAEEHPWERARRAADELVAALRDLDEDKWMAIIDPSASADYPTAFLNRNAWGAEDRIKHHCRELRRAAMEIEPDCTEWGLSRPVDDETDGGRFVFVGSRKIKKLRKPRA